MRRRGNPEINIILFEGFREFFRV